MAATSGRRLADCSMFTRQPQE